MARAPRARPFTDDTTLRLDHPEGVAVASDGSVWCGGEAGQVYRVASDGSDVELVASTGGFVLGLAFDLDDNLYLCDQDRRALLRLPAGSDEVEVVATGSDVHQLRIPNACVCDHQGRIYVTDSYGSGQSGPGVFRFDPDGRGELWYDRPMRFANGIALAEDERTVYVVESFLPGIVAIPVIDDCAGEAVVYADLPATVPDGLLLGPDGVLYVGCYEPSQVLRVADGVVSTVVADPTAHVLCHPTNLARRGDQLFTANLGRWHLTVIEPAPWGTPVAADTWRVS
jgi:gluconolactonase